ncbi:MAG: hypothetical protein WAL95_17505 [Candidatus Acidiferrales bacterium]
MPNSYSTSWKEPYQQALRETDAQTLTELVQAAEYAIVLRLQELDNSADNYEERAEMERAAADLLAIKTYKLGWPAVPTTNPTG